MLRCAAARRGLIAKLSSVAMFACPCPVRIFALSSPNVVPLTWCTVSMPSEPLSPCAGGCNGLVSECGDEAGPLVVGVVIPLITPATEGALLVPCRAILDVPYELVEHVSWLLYEHRRACNTRRRKLGCFEQALPTLVHLRKNETFSRLGAGLGISQATAWRYVDEALDVLASWAPGPHEALTGLGEGDHVIVDSALIPIDRIAADEPYYSQKHQKHGTRSHAGTVAAGPARPAVRG